jgi:hypothetical protein
MRDVTEIHFRDLAKREIKEQADLKNRQQQLQNFEKNRPGLTSDEEKELDRIKAILKAVHDNKEQCDPVFVGMRDMFNANQGILGIELKGHDKGKLVFAALASTDAANKKALAGNSMQDAYVRAALTLGLALADDTDAPQVKVTAKGDIVTDRHSPKYGTLSRGFFAAIGETQSMFELASMALPLLGMEGDSDGPGGSPSKVDTKEYAGVMRGLIAKQVTVYEPQLRRRINECLDKLQSVGENRPITESGIDLPDLEATTDADIVADNVRLMGPMVCAAMFDELKAFQVVDKLVELFQHGMLPIGSGEAGKLLYKYWKEAPNRMSDSERKNFYAMTMGIPGGETGGMVNRDFNDLWLRFVSSVSSYVSQNEVDKLLRKGGLPSAISGQQLRKSARDLAANLSLHGYGMAYYAALDMQDQIRTIIKLLSDKEIRSAYGARDMWQVIDQVATLELGGAKTSSRYRMLATCGTIITAWLANNVQRIMKPTGPILDMNEVLSPMPRGSGKATTDPSDYDLVNACELWLADTGTSDNRVDEMSQPREAPVMTSKPVQIPSIARDMLDSVGMGMSYANGSGGAPNGYARH